MTDWDERADLYQQFADPANDVSDDEEVRVKFFTNERSIKLCFLKNQKYSLPIRLIIFFVKILPCVLYVIQVICDNPRSIEGCCHICENHTLVQHDVNDMDITNVHWDRLFFVNRNYGLWIGQIVCSMLSLSQMFLTCYCSPKGNFRRISFCIDVFIEAINSIPFMASICYPRYLRCLFIPTFLNCWLVKGQFENILGDINRMYIKTQPVVFHRIMNVISSTFCLMFTSVCGFQHLQRGGYRHLNLFESLWFVVVTFSTVGYGDYKPDIWLSQAFMIVMIVVALIAIPLELKKLVHVWLDRTKLSRAYSHYRAKRESHAVLCSTFLSAETILDFLSEFYAHKDTQHFYVCLLSTSDIDNSMKIILRMPSWCQKVIYIQGSALKDCDLGRCRMQDAKACFILAPKIYKDSNSADQHTIMQSWAVKDFAPECTQLVQLFRSENKIHVKFAEHVLCLDELKYSFLGNNALIPGISTLVVLLIHTTEGREGQESPEEWQKIYGKYSGNEVYHVKLGDSKLFKQFDKKSFSLASYRAYRKYNVNLVAISSAQSEIVQINPGPQHILSEEDICYYISLTNENNLSVSTNTQLKENKNGALKRKKWNNTHTSSVDKEVTPCDSPQASCSRNCSKLKDHRDHHDYTNSLGWVIDYPPVWPYAASASCLCHVLRQGRTLCCTQLLGACEHHIRSCVEDYQWNREHVILIVDRANLGLCNFIVPLRSHWVSISDIRPIVFLFREKPDAYFLEIISHIPLVFWMIGFYDSLDDLLRIGIVSCHKVVVVNKEDCTYKADESPSDTHTLIAVHRIRHLFPNVHILTEINHSSNTRFTFFSPDNKNAFTMSEIEKKERVRGSQLSYMFRPPFAAGNVFSTNMLDTILYQTYVKPYLMVFLKLLLGIEQSPGSGHLLSYQLKENEIASIKTYGALYKICIQHAHEIPIGVYRTIRREKLNDCKSNESFEGGFKDGQKLSKTINDRIISLNLKQDENIHLSDDDRTSFVIINPDYNLELQKEDIIYLICPPTQSNTSKHGKQNHECGDARDYSKHFFRNDSVNTGNYSFYSDDLNQKYQPSDKWKPNSYATSTQSSLEKEDRGENIPLMNDIGSSLIRDIV